MKANTSSGIISLPSIEREAIARIFLSKMQMIYIAEPFQICIDFFTWISPFTQESISFPFRENDDMRETKFSTFNKFRSELAKANHWASLSGIYLEVLDEIASKKNYN